MSVTIKRTEKIKAIRDYIPALKELAESFEKCASVAENVPDNVINMMHEMAVRTDILHARIVRRYEKKMNKQ